VSNNLNKYRQRLANRTEPPPSTLYKYVSMSTAHRILTTRQCLWRSPLTLNDPSDCLWNPFWQLDTPEFRSRERDIVRRALSDPSSWLADACPIARDVLYDAHKRFVALGDDEAERFINDMAEHPTALLSANESMSSLQRRLRVFCLSARNDIDTMWTHYGDSHRCIVLGFDTVRLERGWEALVDRVQYSPTAPEYIDIDLWIQKMLFQPPEQYFPDMEGWLLVRGVSWASELEWRFHRLLDFEDGSFTFYDLPKYCLSSITFGMQSSEAERHSLLKLALAPVSQRLVLGAVQRKPDGFGIDVVPCGVL
jgi:hypothetical protein